MGMAIGLIRWSYPSLCANRRIPWLARLLERESAMAMDLLVVMVMVMSVRACVACKELAGGVTSVLGTIR